MRRFGRSATWTDAPAAGLLACLLALAACDGGERAGAAEEPRAATSAEQDSEGAEGEPLALPGGRTFPPHARAEVYRSLRESDQLARSPADGAGEATIEPREPVEAGSRGAWTLHYTAGPEGVAVGGSIVLQISPFWGWSDPQTELASHPGHTRVETAAPGVGLASLPCGTGCLHIQIEDAPLPPGARLDIHYGGEGNAAARVDRFAESEEELFLRIDGDGDGVSAPLASPPGLDIRPGPASELHVVVQSTAAVGEPVFVNVAALDATFNAAAFEGEIEVVSDGGLRDLPERIRLEAGDRGARRLLARAATPGVDRVVVRVPAWGERTFLSNPFEVTAASGVPRVFWADLHGHSGLSDGTGTPDEYLRYARDVAALDVAALTDHDHWGLRFVDREPALWARIRDSVARHHAPGRFVALLGYEWTSWIFGHRHVLYFADDGAVFGSVDPESDEPEELWALLAGQPPALTVAHHPAGEPVPVDWSVPPDPRFEPVVEISSVHGTSECPGCPATLRGAVEGASVRDALSRGYRLGLVGSGDTHDGHPGLGSPENWIRGRTLGLAAVLAERLDRESVLAALRARRVYATSGPRILLRFAVSETPMGGTAPVADPARPRSVYVRAIGTGPIERLDVVKNGQVVLELPGEGRERVEILAEDGSPAADGDYLYVRVVQEDGGMAWSSPIWLDVAPAP